MKKIYVLLLISFLSSFQLPASGSYLAKCSLNLKLSTIKALRFSNTYCGSLGLFSFGALVLRRVPVETQGDIRIPIAFLAASVALSQSSNYLEEDFDANYEDYRQREVCANLGFIAGTAYYTQSPLITFFTAAALD